MSLLTASVAMERMRPSSMDVPRKDGNRRDWGAGILPARAEQRNNGGTRPSPPWLGEPLQLASFFLFFFFFLLFFFLFFTQKCKSAGSVHNFWDGEAAAKSGLRIIGSCVWRTHRCSTLCVLGGGCGMGAYRRNWRVSSPAAARCSARLQLDG